MCPTVRRCDYNTGSLLFAQRGHSARCAPHVCCITRCVCHGWGANAGNFPGTVGRARLVLLKTKGQAASEGGGCRSAAMNKAHNSAGCTTHFLGDLLFGVQCTFELDGQLIEKWLALYTPRADSLKGLHASGNHRVPSMPHAMIPIPHAEIP